MLGQAIVDQLRSQGRLVIATLRHSNPEAELQLKAAGAELRYVDVADPKGLAAAICEADSMIMLPKLPLSSAAVLRAGVAAEKRCVFFSSHNAGVDFTTSIYDEFRAAEAALQSSALACTILRPTMIYGFVGDRNISRLVATFRKLPFAVLPGEGKSRQQPVYYRDLAAVAVAVLDIEATLHQILEVAGPDELCLKDVYRMAANGKPVIALPLGPLRWLARAAGSLNIPFPLSSAQLARVGVDRLVNTPHCLPEAHRPKTPFAAGVAQLLKETA
jgi:uncharacterized protein YbjT (DUF2867 family)